MTRVTAYGGDAAVAAAPPPVRISVGDHGVASVTWETPRTRNAVSGATADALADRLGLLARDPEVRVVLLGAGQAPFCSGWDLSDIRTVDGTSERSVRDFFGPGRRLLAALRSLPQPLVASVRGAAIGFGCSILAGCDLVVADEGAVFGLPEVRHGMAPSTALPELMDAVPDRVALAWAITGRSRSAAQAMAAGLVHEVHSNEDLDAAVDRLVGELAASQRAVQETKALFRRMVDAGPGRRTELGVEHAVEQFLRRTEAADKEAT